MKSALFTALLILLFATAIRADEPDHPQPPPIPQTPHTPAVQSADDAYRAVKQKAAEAYATSLKAAQEEYVKKLDASLKDVMQKGDLDEANRINAWKKWLLDQEPVVGVTPSTGGVVYLSDLEAFDVVALDDRFSKKGVFCLGTNKIVVNRKYSSNGIFIEPKEGGIGSARFELSKNFSQFRTQVALNDTAGPKAWSPITFSVIGDGKELWKSTPIQIPHRIQECSVSVRGVKNLVLQVSCPGSANAGHAVWLEPQLTREDTPKAEHH